jgi:hypothetical protein
MQDAFFFEDASAFQVCICSQSTFAGLVPKHKKITENVDLYYVNLENWTGIKRAKDRIKKNQVPGEHASFKT